MATWATSIVPVATSSPYGTQCYFPDGGLAQDDRPCTVPSGEDAAWCCPPDRECLSNRLCGPTRADQNITRSSCTDRSWHAWDCPHYCMFPDSGLSKANSSYAEILLCNSDPTKPEYCCVGTATRADGDCCPGSQHNFAATNADEDLNLGVISTMTVSMTISASSSIASSMSTPNASATQSKASTASDPVFKGGISSSAAIGMGVALGIVVITLIVLIGLIAFRNVRRARREDPQVPVMQAMIHGQRSLLHELPPDTVMAELKADGDPMELYGDHALPSHPVHQMSAVTPSVPRSRQSYFSEAIAAPMRAPKHESQRGRHP